MNRIRFLTLQDLILIHKDQINRYGGLSGVRDLALLESAISQPKSMFSGKYLHPSFHEMGAAYSFHICQNHPFFDGNKRTALVSMMLFLKFNKIFFSFPHEKIENVLVGISRKRVTKNQVSLFIQEHIEIHADSKARSK